MTAPIILDLCGGTGAWSRPYQEAGYDVRLITLPAVDVRTYRPPANVRGVLAAPPCTEFAVSGARWWAAKDPALLNEAIDVLRSCMRIIDWVTVNSPEYRWWALENPVGRIGQWIGEKPLYTYQPWEYGDPEVKRTCIWGDHVIPVKRPVPGPYTARVWRMAPSPERAALRSITPPGFARAFFEVNP